MNQEKKPMNLTIQNCDDLWSALVVWEKHLDHKNNPCTSRAIKILIKKVRAHQKKFK